MTGFVITNDWSNCRDTGNIILISLYSIRVKCYYILSFINTDLRIHFKISRIMFGKNQEA